MIFRILQIAIPFIWFGLIGGISFMETPLKFQAPNVTIPLGLGIGRLVFYALNKIEIILTILMLITFVKVKLKGKFAHFSFDIIVFLLFLQTVWLLPVLDARAVEVINGTAEPLSESYTHFIYIAFEVIKFVLLFALGVSIAKNSLKLKKMKKDIEMRADIDDLMNRFYARAIKDETIGYIFTDVAKLDLKHHLPIIGDFWETLLFGAGNYQRHGRNPLQVHAALAQKSPLMTKHFRRWLELFTETVDELFAGERAEFAKSRAEAIANRMLNFVSGVPGVEITGKETRAKVRGHQ